MKLVSKVSSAIRMEQLKHIFLLLYILIFLFEFYLKFLNLRHLKKHGEIVPHAFEGQIDVELLKKTRDYTVEHSTFGFFEGIFDFAVVIVFIFGGLLDLYNSWILSWNLPFILSGVLFFLLISLVSTIISIPFSLYSNFIIENKYGFNTMTFKLWMTDFVKSLVISIVLTSIMTAVSFAIIQGSPDFWWIWLWLFILIFGIFMMYISPYIIEPLFHKFTPVQEEELENKIRSLMDKIKIKISKIRVVDASKRSRHSNAYFTGIGRVKRIVLFDNLITSMTHGEILAVLAHEAGHWKKKHILRRIVLVEALSLASLFIAFLVLKSDVLVTIFGLTISSFFAKLILLGFVGSLLMFFFRPLSSYFSRRQETEADRFAMKMIDDRKDLADALVKLSKDNLSNLHPHPLYAFFNYSHPPIQERLRKIIAT
jgi:STE24 endopeptidase